MNPLAIDLYCGLGGWTEGLLDEGYDVVGFDIERHEYGGHKYPARLVLQDVLTLHGAQFRDATLIVASPPCQAYSYRAMPWSRAKALPPPDNTLFEACFRIQREACEAAGRHIPLVVENVRGAQKWVGRARWNYGSYYLWGDVPALMPFTNTRFHKIESPHLWLRDPKKAGGKYAPAYTKGEGVKGRLHGWTGGTWESDGRKNDGSGWGENGTLISNNRMVPDGRKCGGGWFGSGNDCSLMRQNNSKSSARKAASAMIAKIPLPLARHIAAVYRS